MKPFFLEANTIADAWFQLLWNIFDNSYTQKIQKGSFEKEQYRLQYPGIGVYIKYPDQDMVPVIPPHLNLPVPCTKESVEDCFVNYLMDPELPCLRLLDFKAIPAGDGLALTVTCHFRSWDLWAGFPTNLGGIELLKQYVARETGLKNGPMYAYSAGAHIYGYQEEIARIRTMRRES
ncbi:MAG: thymidylate synthase [Nitrospiraceae bacterium]|nr:thymidylate synthase [Nitrospiraceae bacterium]